MSNLEESCKVANFGNKRGFGPLFDFNKSKLPNDEKHERVKRIMTEMKKHVGILDKTDWMFNNKNFDVAFVDRIDIKQDSYSYSHSFFKK